MTPKLQCSLLFCSLCFDGSQVDKNWANRGNFHQENNLTPRQDHRLPSWWRSYSILPFWKVLTKKTIPKLLSGKLRVFSRFEKKTKLSRNEPGVILFDNLPRRKLFRVRLNGSIMSAGTLVKGREFLLDSISHTKVFSELSCSVCEPMIL